MILIQASSAGFEGGNFEKITINDVKVSVEKNESDNLRGLHIVIIDPSNGKVTTAKAFDTYTKHQSTSAIAEFINTEICEGHIVVAACKDECSKNLSRKVKKWFANMGSSEIWNLGYRQGYVFIGVHGRMGAVEQRGTSKKKPVSITKVFALQ